MKRKYVIFHDYFLFKLKRTFTMRCLVHSRMTFSALNKNVNPDEEENRGLGLI